MANAPMDRILFYRAEDAYGCFSNFSDHPIELDGRVWPTTEHYFQAQKFAGDPKEELVRAAPTPGRAARLGRQRDGRLRPDWELVKEAEMERAVLAKFTQHADLRAVLLGTFDAELVEHTRNDRYWADGGDGSGQNRLGVILERVRQRLRGAALVEQWRRILRVPTTSFVLFARGTCVVCADTDPGIALAERAVAVLGGRAPLLVGTPQADFAVSRLGDGVCLVGFDDPDVGVLLLPEEVGEHPDVRLGLLGRRRATLDAGDRVVLHVEDRRGAGAARADTVPDDAAWST